MVWFRGGIKSRGDLLDALKIVLKVAAALVGIFVFTIIFVEIGEALLG